MVQHRWVHLGVAAALAAATASVVGLVRSAGAAGEGTSSVYVPIAPCRLVDTRAGTDNVGQRATPIGPTESVTFAVVGKNGNCAIPAGATGIAGNVTAVNPTAASYLTVYPADATQRPTASNLNYTGGSAPTPNQVTVGLSSAGAIAAYNHAGAVDVIVDVVGYYAPAGTSGAGPTGPAGATGPAGPIGPAGPACPTTGCTAFYSGHDAYNAGGAPPRITNVESNGCLGLNASAFAVLKLNLPIGAKVRDVRIRYQDTSNNALAFVDYTLSVSDDAGVMNRNLSPALRTVDTAPNAIGAGDISIPPGLTPQSRQSMYEVYINVFGSGHSFCGAEVNYTF